MSFNDILRNCFVIHLWNNPLSLLKTHRPRSFQHSPVFPACGLWKDKFGRSKCQGCFHLVSRFRETPCCPQLFQSLQVDQMLKKKGLHFIYLDQRFSPEAVSLEILQPQCCLRAQTSQVEGCQTCLGRNTVSQNAPLNLFKLFAHHQCPLCLRSALRNLLLQSCAGRAQCNPWHKNFI